MPNYPVQVSLSVQVKDERILVRTRFENRGDHVILVKEGEYGYGFGDPNRTCANPGRTRNPEFIIATRQDEAVGYRGWLSYRAPPTKEMFKPIAPGQIIDVRCTRLDGSYAFLPGTHDYKISLIHLQYDETTNEILVHRSVETAFTYTTP